MGAVAIVAIILPREAVVAPTGTPTEAEALDMAVKILHAAQVILSLPTIQ